jgi:AcrR family transcriptional regulator
VFARRGYSGAATTEIAALAQTPTTTLYRQFGDKEGIFTAAVVDPFVGFLSDYATAYAELIDNGDGPAEDFRAIFGPSVTMLWQHLEPHQDAVLALISAVGDPEAEPAMRAALDRVDQVFHEFNAMSRDHWERSGRAYDIDRSPLWTRLVTAMVVSMTALGPIFRSSKESDEQIIGLITDMLTGGIR